MIRLFAFAFAAVSVAAPTYAYDNFAPLDLNIETTADEGAVHLSSISYRSQGQVMHATLVGPKDESQSEPGVLFVRDAGGAASGDQSPFFEDAKWLARRGSVSLIVDFVWTQPHWLDRLRGYDTDYRDSVSNVIDVRRALDMLAASGPVDKTRIAIVAQGIGGTYAALATGVDTRPAAVVFIAPDLSLAKRYERGTGKRPADPAAYESALGVFDTRAALGRSSFTQSFLQFAKHDKFVSHDDADAISDAIPGNNKSVVFYDSDHALGLDAPTDERRTWLGLHLFSR